ncbi:DUF1643 domain-containing protein [Sporosarcina psychrophila]|uniref:DUF1643 domain-containing protein n=1 Tax=Sporosarcina psychrophila TaxID=1476 RepID=A0ABV2KBG6_SPOPS
MGKRNYDTNLVNTEKIKASIKPLNSNVEIRTSLRIPLKRGIASCILMNPSAADNVDSDNTINVVTKYIYENFPNIQRIRYFNLYPFYEPSSTNIYPLIHNLTSLEYDRAMIANRKAIKKTLDTTTHLFLGYGQCSGNSNDKTDYYDIETAEILSMLEKRYTNETFVFETSQSDNILIKGKYPRHPNPNNEHMATNHHKCHIKNGSIIIN